MAIVKKIPASENGPGVECKTAEGIIYIISQCYAPRRFTLWEKKTGGYEKLATASTPTELYEKIKWESEEKKKPRRTTKKGA